MSDARVALRGDRSFLVGWLLVLLISAALGFSSLYVLAVPVDDGFFEDVTGLAWEEFSTANPDVAVNMERENRLLGITGLGLAMFALAVTWSRLRRAEPWAAAVLWILPLTLAAVTALFAVDGITTLALFYGAQAIVAATGLILVTGALRRAQDSGAAGDPTASVATT